MQPWKTKARRVLLAHSRWLTVEEHTVELPDGAMIRDWPWIITPDFVNVVAVTEDGRFVLFRQTKYAIGGETLAPVGGYLEPGEDPLAAAQRELREETGCEAAEWTRLGEFVMDANRGVATAHLLLARAARQVEEPREGDLEEQALILLSRADVEAALLAGRFRITSWVAAIALALRVLDRGV